MIDFDVKGRFKSLPRNKAGLDIGSYAIKMVEIQDASLKPRLLGLGLKKIQGSSKEKLADSIKALAEEARISAKTFNISVSGPSCIVRIISMPRMKDEELKGAIKFEAEKFIPFNINDCIVDYQITKKDDKENKFDILLVAVKKDYVEENVKMVESCGYSVSLVDVDGFAVTNSFFRNHPAHDSDRTIALLNIGSTLTNLSIIKGDMLCLVRDVAIGGNDLNAAISKSLNIDIGAAEGLLFSPQERSQDVIACLRPVLNNLVDEIRTSCSYYENQCGRNVDEFYVSGGGSITIGLEEALQEAFGSKPALWNPMQFLDIDSSLIDKKLLDKSSSSFAVSVGLALR